MQSPNAWVIGGQPAEERPAYKHLLHVVWDRRKHVLNGNPSQTWDNDSISRHHATQIHRVYERHCRIVKRANAARNHLEAMTMHVERMAARAAHTLQDDSYGLVPICVGDDHEVSLLWGRRSPRWVLLNGVQSGIRSVVNLVDLTIHKGMDIGSTEEGECVVEKH